MLNLELFREAACCEMVCLKENLCDDEAAVFRIKIARESGGIRAIELSFVTSVILSLQLPLLAHEVSRCDGS
jgi:hypothetical protein